MKKLYTLVFLFFACTFLSSAQSTLRIRDIYNFNVGDEFHYSGSTLSFGGRISGSRTKILSKWYSSDSSTLYYSQETEGYTAVRQTTFPYDYTITRSGGVGTISYTKLDSLASTITKITVMDSCDSETDTMYQVSEWCGKLVFEDGYCQNCCFEGTYYKAIYSEGLGLLSSEFVTGMGETSRDELVFYKKGNDSCGIRNDLMYTGLKVEVEKPQIAVYPNPAAQAITIDGLPGNAILMMFDAKGEQVFHSADQMQRTIDLSGLPHGLYLLKVETRGGVIVKRVVVE